MKTGVELIVEERQRQIEKEGWTFEHDSLHQHDELARAAATYATPNRFRSFLLNGRPATFPWVKEWWKPTPNNRIKELVKAGALIAAEIDRLQKG